MMIEEMIAQLFKVLGHPTRVRILKELRDAYTSGTDEMCVCELIPLLGIEQSNLSQHLSNLKSKGLLISRREGSSVYYKVADESVFELLDSAENFIEKHIKRVKSILEE